MSCTPRAPNSSSLLAWLVTCSIRGKLFYGVDNSMTPITGTRIHVSISVAEINTWIRVPFAGVIGSSSPGHAGEGIHLGDPHIKKSHFVLSHFLMMEYFFLYKKFTQVKNVIKIECVLSVNLCSIFAESLKPKINYQRQNDYLDFFLYLCLFSICLRF